MSTWADISDFLIDSQVQQLTATASKAEHPDNVLTLFATAQAHLVDLLPISSQRFLGSVGRGASGDILQSSIVKELGLAFKEFSALPGSREALLRSMGREICILQHPPIQACTNIIHLEGICWKLDDSNTEISPILVYRLVRSLASHLAETEVSFESRLQYVKDIGNGLMALHASGVVHGDLKPENIIMNTDHSVTPPTQFPQIADFGSSQFLLQVQDRFHVPRSTPWCAPEWHARLHTIEQAQRMDVYSYGLLSYWILFSSCQIDMEIFSKDLLLLKDSLAKGQLREILVQHIPKSSQRETLVRDLEAFFYGCLSCDLQRRFPIVSQSIGLLRDIVPGIQNTIAEAHQQHAQFDLANSMDQLLQVDYRIRKNLFEVLEESLDSTCSDCAQNGALQLSLCHTMGFGTSRDPEAVISLVSREKIIMSDLQQRLEIIRECRFPNRLGQAKWYVEPDLVSSYQESGCLQRAVDWHTKELEALKECFGANHRLVAMATTTLALLLDEAGQTSKALNLCIEQHAEITSRVSKDHHDAITVRSQVALYQWKNGNTTEAITTGEQLAELLRTSLSIQETDRLALACFSNLAGAYVDARLHQQAIPIMERLMNLHDRVLGRDHPDSLMNRQSLAASYLESIPPRHQEARELQATVLDGWRKSFGPGHRSTIKAASMYASILFREGHDDDLAIDMYRWCMEAAKEHFSNDQPDTWLAVGNYGYELLRWKRYDEAIHLLQQSLSNLERILLVDHKDTVDVILKLAAAYNASGETDEAEALYLRALGSKACTDEHTPTVYLWVWEGLGDIYHKRGHNERAKESWQEALRHADKHWSVHHSAVREAMRSLGVLLIQEGHPDEGINLLKQVVAWCQEYLGKGSYWTIIYTNELGTNYSAIGMHAQAYELLSEIYLHANETLGDMKPETMDVQGNLAYAAHRVDKSLFAKELAEDLLSKRRVVLGQLHEDTVLSIRNLFRIYLDLQLWPELELLVPQAFLILDMITDEAISHASNLRYLLAEYFSMNGNSSKGEEFFRNQLNNLEERGNVDKTIDITNYCLAYILSDTVKIREAEEIMRNVLAHRVRVHGEFSYATYEAQGLLGVILRDSGNLAEAEGMFEQELRTASSLQNGLEPSDKIDAYEHLITIYRKQSRTAQILHAEQKIADLRSS